MYVSGVGLGRDYENPYIYIYIYALAGTCKNSMSTVSWTS